MKFTWDQITRRISKIFRWYAIIKSRENKLPSTKIQQKFILVTLLNFNEIGCKQCNENDHIESIFVTFKYCTWNPRKLIPTFKAWNPNSRFFPRNLKSKICEIKLPRKKFPPHGKLWTSLFFVQFECVCIRTCNNHEFGNCVNFSGKKVTAPKSESARTPMLETKITRIQQFKVMRSDVISQRCDP